MKETEPKNKDEIKVVSEKQIEKQLKFIGDIFVKPNQRCYEYDTITGELVIAKTECIINPFATGKKIDLYNGVVTGQNKLEQKIIIRPGCYYTVALNFKNAERRLKRHFSI